MYPWWWKVLQKEQQQSLVKIRRELPNRYKMPINRAELFKRSEIFGVDSAKGSVTYFFEGSSSPFWMSMHFIRVWCNLWLIAVFARFSAWWYANENFITSMFEYITVDLTRLNEVSMSGINKFGTIGSVSTAYFRS